jgi:Na+-driven multidrug efflux pump
VFDIFRKFLQGQQIVWPVVVAALCSLVLNVFLNHLLVVQYQFGFRGAGISQVICQWSSLVILISIILTRKWYISRGSNKQESQAQRRTHSSDPMMTTNHGPADGPVYAPVPLSVQSDIDADIDIDDDFEADNSDTPISAHAQSTAVTPATATATATATVMAVADSEDNWPPLSMSIFQDWGVFLSLGIPGALSLLLEWGSYEAIASIAGKLGEVGLATHGIYMSTAGVFYLAPAAIATATSTLAGNRLGDNDAEGAKYFIKLGLWVDFCWGILAGLFLVLILRPYWGPLYTNDEHVRRMVFENLPIMLLYTTVDSTKCITLNVLRSTGRPGITVVGNVVACLCVMLPLGYYLVVQRAYGVRGLWFAMSMAWLIATIYYLFVVVTTDWQSQADLARLRNDKAQELARQRSRDDHNEQQQQQQYALASSSSSPSSSSSSHLGSRSAAHSSVDDMGEDEDAGVEMGEASI